MFGRRRPVPASRGPVDVDGIKSLIADVLATLPPAAARVEESRERLQQRPEAPEDDLGYLRLHVIPRTFGALDVAIDVHEQGMVNVWVGEYLPIELTAPININAEAPHPFLDVVGEVLTEAVAGKVDGEVVASPWS